MRKLEHQNIVKLKFFFYSSGEKVREKVEHQLLFFHFDSFKLNFDECVV